MSASGASIRQQLGAEDERLARRIRRWTIVPALMGLVVLAASFLSIRFATARAREANAQLAAANARLEAAKDSTAALDREIETKRAEQLALQQVIARLGTIVARSDEGVARQALEQAVRSTPGAATVVPIVYIQFRGGIKRSVLEGLRADLNAAGYSAPGTERIDEAFTSRVKYFHPGDSALAGTVAKRAEAFLRERGCPVELPVRTDRGVAPRSAPRQIELWVNTNCPGVT